MVVEEGCINIYVYRRFFIKCGGIKMWGLLTGDLWSYVEGHET